MNCLRYQSIGLSRLQRAAGKVEEMSEEEGAKISHFAGLNDCHIYFVSALS